MRDLTAAQATAETTLIYDVTVTRAATGEPTIATGSGQPILTPPAPTTVWTGRCSVSADANRVGQLGGRDEILATHTIRVPMAATGILPGDVAHIDRVTPGVPAASADPDLIGANLVIAGALTSRVLRRFTATLVQAGEDVAR